MALAHGTLDCWVNLSISAETLHATTAEQRTRALLSISLRYYVKYQTLPFFSPAKITVSTTTHALLHSHMPLCPNIPAFGLYTKTLFSVYLSALSLYLSVCLFWGKVMRETTSGMSNWSLIPKGKKKFHALCVFAL